MLFDNSLYTYGKGYYSMTCSPPRKAAHVIEIEGRRSVVRTTSEKKIMLFLDSCISLVSPEKRTLFSKVLKGRVKKDLNGILRGAVVDGRRLVTTVKEVARKELCNTVDQALILSNAQSIYNHIDTMKI